MYCFDADTITGANGGPLWHVNFNLPNNQAVPTSGTDVTDIFGLPQGDIQPLIGIIGTPVIDTNTNTLYVVVRTTEGTSYFHRLHAIDITTGLERFYSPQLIGEQEDSFGNVTPVVVPGNGDDFDGNGNVFFDLLNENQRPALTEVTDPTTHVSTIYIAYGSFEESPPYHGWMFAFNASNLNPTGIFNTTPNASSAFTVGAPATEGGIDMGGSGPAADATSLYFTTGDGIFNANTGGTEYGSSVLKLGLTAPGPAPAAPYLPALPVLSYFAPFNNVFLTTNGIDLGRGGVALLPDVNPLTGQPQTLISGHPHALVTAATEGRIYLLDRDNMGGFHAGSDQGAITTIPNALGPVNGAPAVYASAGSGTQPAATTIYYHGTGDVLRGFTVSSGAPYLNPATHNGLPVAGTVKYGVPGAMPVVSSNSGANGIIWEVEGRITQYPDPTQGGIQNQRPFAILHAYDATTLAHIFDSSAAGGGASSIGDYINNTIPMVANGKVYVTGGIPSQFDPGNGPPVVVGGGAGPAPTGAAGRLCVFGPVVAPPRTQGYHYQLSGPVGWAATSTGQNPLTAPIAAYPTPALVGSLPGPGLGVVNVSRPNYYSITALDSNNNVVNITTTAHITLIDQFTGNTLPVANVTFNNQSNIVVPLTLNNVGEYRMVVRDANGNSSQDNPNFPYSLGFFPQAYFPTYSDQSILFVVPSVQAGVDHFSIRTGPAVKDGVPTNISITAVNSHGIPVPGYANFVIIYDTVPTGVQDFSLPADANPVDGFGFTNSLIDEPALTPHALNLLTGRPDVTPNKFAYEFQYGVCDFAIVAGENIGISDQIAGEFGTQYPNPFGTGTYPCIFHGVGKHVIIVADALNTLAMSTTVVNVIGPSTAPTPVASPQ